jgi:hypothetical protein
MRIKINSFPAVYFHATCTKHNCPVNLQVHGDKSFAGQITSLTCDLGGDPTKADCTDSWELTVDSGGSITIVR